MKRRSVAVSILIGLVFWTGKEVNRAEKDIDYFNEHVLSSSAYMAPEADPDIKDAVKNSESAKPEVKNRKRRRMDPEKIYEDADYLVKIRIFKMITIPGTEQTIPRDTEGFGSGTVVKCEKYNYCVLTAFHVVDNSSMTYFAEPKDGSPAQMLELIHGTTHYDTALLRFADPDYVPKKTAVLGKSSALKAGAPIHAMGSNRYGDFWFSAGGHLYTPSKQANPVLRSILNGSGLLHPKLLLFNTPVFHGYSGGPLHNKYGEVIGVTVGYTALDEEPIYIGAPIDEIREIHKILK